MLPEDQVLVSCSKTKCKKNLQVSVHMKLTKNFPKSSQNFRTRKVKCKYHTSITQVCTSDLVGMGAEEIDVRWDF